MSTLDLRTATLDDIVFEGRNKAYGAFLLRQLYHRHLARALAIAVSLTLLFVSVPIVVNRLFPPVTVAPGVIDLPGKGLVFIDPPVFEPEKLKTNSAAAAPAPPPTPPITDVVPTVVSNPTRVDPVTEPVPPIVGPIEAEGEVSGPYTSPTGTGSGNGPGIVEAGGEVEAPAPPAPVLVAEVMPQFIGGNEALMEYMKKNLHYPLLALRNGVEGRVSISFTVQTDGSIADVKVLKGLGYGTDEEASRVVKNMPAWIPGQQNKRTVAVRYTMPITFQYK